MNEDHTIFIADANFFIEGNTTVRAPHTIYTTQDALNEVRDQRSRQNLEKIKVSHEVTVKEPSRESYDAVFECAKSTGNSTLLSQTDMRLIALALDMTPGDDASEEEESSDAAAQGFDTWITVDNYGEIEKDKVILCTADANMQSVAIVLGVHVVSPTGQRLAEVKRWLLRCAACGEETLEATKEFCPSCGQHELVRYALVIRADGEHELPLPKRFIPTHKGKRYSIPTKRGGKHQKPRLILSEDMMWEARRKFAWTGGARAMKANAADGHTFFEPRRKAPAVPTYGNTCTYHHSTGKKKKSNRK